MCIYIYICDIVYAMIYIYMKNVSHQLMIFFFLTGPFDRHEARGREMGTVLVPPALVFGGEIEIFGAIWRLKMNQCMAQKRTPLPNWIPH